MDGKNYMIPTVPGRVYERRDGFRDQLVDTGVRAGRQVIELGKGAFTVGIVTDVENILSAQQLVANLFPRTPTDIVEYGEYMAKAPAWVLVGGETNFGASDYFVVLGDTDSRYVFHPVAILLSARSQGANLKGFLLEAMGKIRPGMLAEVLTRE